jgi:flagellar basal-body rod protein FlgG
MFDLYVGIGNTLNGLSGGLRIMLANAQGFNAPGFKYFSPNYETVFSRVVGGATRVTNPSEFPGGITLASTDTDFSQGSITFGTHMDNAIIRDGFFILSKSARNFIGAEQVYTRVGRFQVDSTNTYIVDANGRKVFGYRVDSSGNPIDNNLVPIQTNGESDIGFEDGGILVADYQKHKDEVKAEVENPTQSRPMYRLALTTFPNKQGLVLENGSAWSASIASGDPLPPGIANSDRYGDIRGSALEGSNVDVARIALDLAVLNRSFTAVQGLIDDVNKVTSGLISKLQ